MNILLKNQSDDQEHLVSKTVICFFELADGRRLLIEGIPARVNEETGDQWFSPDTARLLEEIALGSRKPERVVEMPVYKFSLEEPTNVSDETMERGGHGSILSSVHL